MSNNRYLEIDSTNRDRTRFPLPGHFEVPISVSGRKNVNVALDPVCLSTPIISWTSNNLSVNIPQTYKLTCSIEPKTTLLSGTTDTSTFIINSSNRLQQQDNYYANLLVEDAAFFNRRRIKTYKFLGSFGSYDRAMITVESSFPETLVPSNIINIYDPTDLSNYSYPLFWIPNGTNRDNGYCNCILYNETLNEYRKITNYIAITGLLQIDPSTPITSSWTTTDNYSIRKDTPFYPNINGITPEIESATTNTFQSNINLSSIGDILQKYIRILPVGVYNYPTINITDNTYYRIVSYDSSTNTARVFPNFPEIPADNTPFEILSVSYDNLNPFIYTGSLLSQQELVCYEIELLSLILPTETLSVAEGGPITLYPYIYVELSNTCNSGNKNIIYSNNPNSTRALFRVPLFDIQDNPVFIKVGGGMLQTIKFKPNDTLLFSVWLPNGEIFNTILEDKLSPSEPDSRIQISAMFAMKRIIER